MSSAHIPRTRRTDSLERRRGFGRALSGIPYFAFGVVTPLLALAAEASGSVWASIAGDPIPTPVHLAAVALVPFVVAWLHGTRDTPDAAPAEARGWLWGAATAIAAWYTLDDLRFIPLALIAVVWFGLGLLPLSPLTALIALLRRAPPRELRRQSVLGAVVALVALCAADVPNALVYLSARRAGTETSGPTAAEIQALRAQVRPAEASEWVTHGPPAMLSPLGTIVRLLCPWSPEGAQVVAWRVTGDWTERSQGFSAVPLGGGLPPRRMAACEVGPVERDLQLTGSSQTAHVHPSAGVAMVDWELTFLNDSLWERQQLEPRARIELPAGAVVCGVWIDGDETRRTRVAPASVARNDYETLVHRGASAALVTPHPGGGYMVQCSPLPGDGGTSQLTVRLATPLEADSGELSLPLPRLRERNFDFAADARRTLEIVGDRETSRGLEYAADTLDRTRSVPLDHDVGAASWTAADPHTLGQLLRGRTELLPTPTPTGVVLVVDASASTARHSGLIASALDSLPDGTPTAVVFASDEVVEATRGLEPLDDGLRGSIGRVAGKLPWAGGVDATPALERGLLVAASRPGSRLVWLHGDQLCDVPPRVQRHSISRRPLDAIRAAVTPGEPDLWALRLSAGENRLLSELLELADPRTLPVGTVPPAAATQALLTGWFDGTPRLVLDLRREGRADPSSPTSIGSVPAAAPLWARRRVAELRRDSAEEALALAMTYGIVSRDFGVVVGAE